MPDSREANPQRLFLPIIIDPEYHYETVNVEAQQNNPNSLLWWMKRIIQQRKQFKAFGRGTIEFLHPDNRQACWRSCGRYEDENILVVANLSRFPQHVQLELPAFLRGMAPTEIFGGAEFPPITDALYPVTLSGHGFFWFSLNPQKSRSESVVAMGPDRKIPELSVRSLNSIADDDRTVAAITRLVREFLPTRRWFRSKTRRIRTVTLQDLVPLPEAEAFMSFLRVEFVDGDPEDYMLPVAIAKGDAAQQAEEQFRDTVLARLRSPDGDGVMYGALWKPAFADALLNVIARRKRLRGRWGEIVGVHTKAFRQIWGGRDENLQTRVSAAEQSNSSIVFGERFILKLFRKVEPGANPDIEISQFLGDAKFGNTPPLAGYLEYRPDEGEPIQLAILQGFVPNQGDAWNHTVDALSRYFERALASTDPPQAPAGAQQHPLVLMNEEPPANVADLIGEYLASARLLGVRTAQMHKALVQPTTNVDFAPEPLSEHYRQGLYHGMLSLTNQTLQMLRGKLDSLPEPAARDANWVLEHEEQLRARFRSLRSIGSAAVRIRHHGDFHLGQVLYTGQDFVIIDFEGEPARPLSERRLKRSPIRDAAGMMRSFQYAAYAALFGQVPGVTARPDQLERLRASAELWTAWVSAVYLKGYLQEAGNDPYIPQSPDALKALLDAFLLEKAIYEVAYELNNRPDWVRIPLAGIATLLV